MGPSSHSQMKWAAMAVGDTFHNVWTIKEDPAERLGISPHGNMVQAKVNIKMASGKSGQVYLFSLSADAFEKAAVIRDGVLLILKGFRNCAVNRSSQATWGPFVEKEARDRFVGAFTILVDLCLEVGREKVPEMLVEEMPVPSSRADSFRKLLLKSGCLPEYLEDMRKVWKEKKASITGRPGKRRRTLAASLGEALRLATPRPGQEGFAGGPLTSRTSGPSGTLPSPMSLDSVPRPYRAPPPPAVGLRLPLPGAAAAGPSFSSPFVPSDAGNGQRILAASLGRALSFAMSRPDQEGPVGGLLRPPPSPPSGSMPTVGNMPSRALPPLPIGFLLPVSGAAAVRPSLSSPSMPTGGMSSSGVPQRGVVGYPPPLCAVPQQPDLGGSLMVAPSLPSCAMTSSTSVPIVVPSYPKKPSSPPVVPSNVGMGGHDVCIMIDSEDDGSWVPGLEGGLPSAAGMVVEGGGRAPFRGGNKDGDGGGARGPGCGAGPSTSTLFQPMSDLTEAAFFDSFVLPLVVESFDDAKYNFFIVEGMPGDGKTGLMSALIARLRDRFPNEPSVVLFGALRGAVSQLSGGETLAKIMDMAVIDGSARNDDGSARREVHPESRAKMLAGKFMVIDEYEELRGMMLTQMDVQLRRERNVDRPFGGLFVFLFGNCLQMPQVKNRLASYKDGRVVVQPDNPDYPWNARCLEDRTLKVLKLKVASTNFRAKDEKTLKLWKRGYLGLPRSGDIEHRQKQKRSISEVNVLTTLILVQGKDKAMQYHNVEFRKPEYHLYDGIKQHPDYLEGVNYEAPATFLVRLCEVDRRYLEVNAMPFWSSLRVQAGDMVVSLGNQSAGSNNMLTGMCGVVTGLEFMLPHQYERSLAARLARSHGTRASKDAAVSKEMGAIRSLCGTQDGHLVLPVVRFGSRSGNGAFHLTVHPQFRVVTAMDGTSLMERYQIPLAGGRAVKYGMSLGCEAPDNVYLDLSSGSGTSATHPFMGLTRHGDPHKVFISQESAIGSDTFMVPEAVHDWYGGKGYLVPWRGLLISRNESRVHKQGFANISKWIEGMRGETVGSLPMDLDRLQGHATLSDLESDFE